MNQTGHNSNRSQVTPIRKRESSWNDRLFKGDKVLWIIISILIFMSLMVVYSSTASMAYRRMGGDTTHYLIDQFEILIMGIAVIFCIHRFDYRFFGRWALFIYLGSLASVLATYFIGMKYNDASRWLNIFGFSFQPSDALRLALVLLLAKQIDLRCNDIDKAYLLPLFGRRKKDAPSNMKILTDSTIPLVLPILIACVVIVFSNLSTAVMTFITGLGVLFLGRVRIWELIRLCVIVSVAGVLLVGGMYFSNVGRAETWVNRITNFVSDTDEGGGDNLQQEQAKITVASGGLFWGKGPGQSTQRSNLPHSYSDFAFAFIIEEYGDLVAGLVLFCYLWLFARSRLIFKQSNKMFPSMLVLGLSLMITLQALVNMMVSVGLGPVTGQTLPLISKGGSSVLFTGIALGMILGVSRQVEQESERKQKAPHMVVENR